MRNVWIHSLQTVFENEANKQDIKTYIKREKKGVREKEKKEERKKRVKQRKREMYI